jgi:hypothetical protein
VQQLGVRDVVGRRLDRRALDQQYVDVERPRRVARRVQIAAQRDLDPLRGCEQRLGVELGLDGDARVQEVALTDGAGLRLGFVDVRAGADGDPVASERITTRSEVRKPVADVGPEPEPGSQTAPLTPCAPSTPRP